MSQCPNVPLWDWSTHPLCCWECWQLTAVRFPSLGTAFSWKYLSHVPFPGASPYPMTSQGGNTKPCLPHLNLEQFWRTIPASELPMGSSGPWLQPTIAVKFPLPRSASLMPLRWRSWEHCSINFLHANLSLRVISQEIWTVTNCFAVVFLGSTQVKYWVYFQWLKSYCFHPYSFEESSWVWKINTSDSEGHISIRLSFSSNNWEGYFTMDQPDNSTLT